MKTIEVTWGGTFGTGNFQNEKISATAEVDEGQSPETAIAVLKEFVLAQASKSVQDEYLRKHILEREIAELEEKAKEAKAEWEQIAAFLVAQGLKPDGVASFPVLKLLGSASSGRNVKIIQDRDNDSSCEIEDFNLEA
jgi:hypothetical protein